MIGTRPFENFPKPVKGAGSFSDFLVDSDLDKFVITEYSGDGGEAAPAAVADFPGGAYRFNGKADTDASGQQIQAPANQYDFDKGVIDYQLKFRMSDAFNSIVRAGVSVVDSSIIASAPANGFWVAKDNDSYALKLQVYSGGSLSKEGTIGDIANDQLYHVALKHSPAGKECTAWVYTINADGVETLLNTVTLKDVTIPVGNGAEMAAFQQKFTSGTLTFDIDYIGSQGAR